MQSLENIKEQLEKIAKHYDLFIKQASALGVNETSISAYKKEVDHQQAYLVEIAKEIPPKTKEASMNIDEILAQQEKQILEGLKPEEPKAQSPSIDKSTSNNPFG